MPAPNATSRFSDRVENYVRYRPGYPEEALRVLRNDCGLTASHVVADIASGTGIWTRMLLQNGNRVFGVEPNPEMRRASDCSLIFRVSSVLREWLRRPRWPTTASIS